MGTDSKRVLTYVSKVSIQDLDVAMDDFQSDQFIVVLVDAYHKE
jgi:hypothetical protein